MKKSYPCAITRKSLSCLSAYSPDLECCVEGKSIVDLRKKMQEAILHVLLFMQMSGKKFPEPSREKDVSIEYPTKRIVLIAVDIE